MVSVRCQPSLSPCSAVSPVLVIQFRNVHNCAGNGNSLFRFILSLHKPWRVQPLIFVLCYATTYLALIAQLPLAYHRFVIVAWPQAGGSYYEVHERTDEEWRDEIRSCQRCHRYLTFDIALTCLRAEHMFIWTHCGPLSQSSKRTSDVVERLPESALKSYRVKTRESLLTHLTSR